ncbi:MAG: GNAT family N-acetyltransferase [Deltaproteobacteria bacterium]|nr:GNAT family N-acetyltransferase [Deltaproteobacteria bacterium]
MLHRRIEEASLKAWPALQQMLLAGWLLRFARGYTQRANSVPPLFGSSLNAEEKIELCERLYAEKEQPASFRLTPFAVPPDLEQVLVRRHYRLMDRTHVQHLNWGDRAIQTAPVGERRNETVDNWLDTFCRLSAAPLAKPQTHKEMRQALPAKRVLAVLADSATIVACGLGVLEQEYFGLFELVTDRQQRHKGYGAQLVSGMVQWAQAHAAAHAYLQVMTRNAPARHRYAKLGFADVYQYWYRVPDA